MTSSGDNNTLRNSASFSLTTAPASENNQSHTFVANTQCITSTLSVPQQTILLCTCELDIKDIRGNFQKIRILLDTGSMANFMSESCARRLGLNHKKLSIPIEGLNGMSTFTNSGLVHCVNKLCCQPEPIFFP